MNNANFLIEKEYQIRQELAWEGKFAQGNGYMHTRGNLEEELIEKPQAFEYLRKPGNVTAEEFPSNNYYPGFYIPIVTDIHPLLNRVMVNLPVFWGFNCQVNGVLLELNPKMIISYQRSLNLKTGELKRATVWKVGKIEVEINFSRFISKANSHLSMEKISIRCLKNDAKIIIKNGISANVRTNGFNHFEECQRSHDENGLFCKVLTISGISVETRLNFKMDKTLSSRIEMPTSEILKVSEFELKENQSFNFEKAAFITTSEDNPELRNPQTLNQALEGGYEKQLFLSNSIWKKEDEQCGIIIETKDPRIQEGLNFSIYHLLRSQNKFDDRITICPKGFAGDAYFGRYFWDTDVYIVPFFSVTDSERAKKLVLFRYRTLAGAKQNALKYGCKGSKFPWESDIYGNEGCPNWQYADNEIHITGDVAYSVWYYFKNTKDYDFLFNYGFEVLLECAKYFESRMDKLKDGSYGFLGVMGPDEYTLFSSNNFYTNEIARFTFSLISIASEKLLDKDKNRFSTLLKNLNTDLEKTMNLSAKGLMIKEGNVVNGVIQQCDEFDNFINYNGKIERNIGKKISLDKLYRTKILKQADVLAHMVMFQENFSKKDFVVNYEYYEKITSHDSSLSYAIHSQAALLADKKDIAYNFFEKAILLDLNKEENEAEQGIHIANAGGALDTVIFGFCGISIDNITQTLKINPRFPNQIECVKMNFEYLGQRLFLKIKKDSVEVRLNGESKNLIGKIKIFNENYIIPDSGKLLAKKESSK